MSATLLSGCVELIPIEDVTHGHKVVDGNDWYLWKSSDLAWASVTLNGFAIYSYSADPETGEAGEPADVVGYVDRNRDRLGALGAGAHFGYWKVEDETGEVSDFIVSAKQEAVPA